jgi:biotin synthase
VLQGGEDMAMSDETIAQTVAKIRREFPKHAITLSLGERGREAFQRFYDAGAERYLLRHETANNQHYNKLHPASMSLENRMKALDDLREIGYQVGTGIMVGSPGQTLETLVEDILFIERFRPEMVGLGPILPQSETPFCAEPAGSLRMTLMLLAIFRLIMPRALIPSTTSLATLTPEGRSQGILAGANVVMPNLSPAEFRALYALYDGKRSFGSEAAEGVAALSAELESIGYHLAFVRGDYR